MRKIQIKILKQKLSSIFFYCIFLCACGTSISEGLYVNKDKKNIILIKDDSVLIFTKTFMSSGYDTYYGKRELKKNANSVWLKLYGYDRIADSLNHVDSISTEKIDFYVSDSVKFYVSLYHKADYWPISGRMIRIYKKKKLIQKVYTDVNGTVDFLVKKNEINKIKVSYNTHHPMINLMDYQDKKINVYVAFSIDEDINYLPGLIKVKIRPTKEKNSILVNGVKSKQISKDELEKFIIDTMKMELPKFWQ